MRNAPQAPKAAADLTGERLKGDRLSVADGADAGPAGAGLRRMSNASAAQRDGGQMPAPPRSTTPPESDMTDSHQPEPHKPESHQSDAAQGGEKDLGKDLGWGQPAPAEGAERFNQARAAQSVAVLEDYVEMIDDLTTEMGEARITDIAARMGVAHPTATKAVARLKREGLAVSRPYRGVFLTAQGSALAARVRQRHRVVVDLLVAVGVPPDTAEIDAEGLEHHVSDTTLKAFEAFLAQRVTD